MLSVTSGFLGGKGIASPRLEAELLLGRALGLSRIGLSVSPARELTAEEVDGYRELVRRRAGHEPAAYILGEREFYSLPFKVTPCTLIPRPETEHLVDEAVLFVRGLTAPRPGPAAAPAAALCDVGTGCGAIAAALARNLPQASVEASDVSPGALACARENLAALGLADRVNLVEGDLLDAPFRSHLFDAVCANLPYIPSSMIAGLPPDVRDYEPRSALDGGPDGLALHRRLLPQAAGRLRPGGAVFLECQPDQFPALEAAARACGLSPRPPALDYSGRERIFSAASL
ncbi:MAG: peptide chain release factor N(5)-glutamine methyltransferase [Deltaproteobacteria bacterium]|jgi:release factor glutamine methyltransferase|nr:peptide chain release factor N(5)-glutamine methyltransferase [Deltaproteobacteria bacterium]